MWAILNHFLAGKQSQTEAATLSFPGPGASAQPLGCEARARARSPIGAGASPPAASQALQRPALHSVTEQPRCSWGGARIAGARLAESARDL